MKPQVGFAVPVVCLVCWSCSAVPPAATWQDTYRGTDGLLYLRSTDQPFSGVVVSKYADGVTRARTPYVRGIPHGTHRSWHENGRLASMIDYSEGQRKNRWTRWYPNGHMQENIKVSHGKVLAVANYYSTGELCILSTFDWDEKIIRQIVYDKEQRVLSNGTVGIGKGRRRRNGTFCNTEHTSLVIEDYSDGQLISRKDSSGNAVELKKLVRHADEHFLLQDQVRFLEGAVVADQLPTTGNSRSDVAK